MEHCCLIIQMKEFVNLSNPNDIIFLQSDHGPYLKFGEKNIVESFREKPVGDGSWVNGGFFVLNPNVIELIKDDHTSWEHQPLSTLSKNSELYAFKHDGFWQPMDTLREKNMLNELWIKGNAPWKTWK